MSGLVRAEFMDAVLASSHWIALVLLALVAGFTIGRFDRQHKRDARRTALRKMPYRTPSREDAARWTS